MQFSTKIDGFEQRDSQGFENFENSYEQYPLEKFFIFTIYQNYTLALMTFKTHRKSSHSFVLQMIQMCSFHIVTRITLINIMNNELKLVQSWIHANKLSLNIEKTNFMFFSNSWRVLRNHIRIDDNNLCQIDTTKFLGLHIDKEFTWKTHCNS